MQRRVPATRNSETIARDRGDETLRVDNLDRVKQPRALGSNNLRAEQNADGALERGGRTFRRGCS